MTALGDCSHMRVEAATGQFATLWQQMATRLGLVPQLIPTDWRRGADPAGIEAHLREAN